MICSSLKSILVLLSMFSVAHAGNMHFLMKNQLPTRHGENQSQKRSPLLVLFERAQSNKGVYSVQKLVTNYSCDETTQAVEMLSLIDDFSTEQRVKVSIQQIDTYKGEKAGENRIVNTIPTTYNGTLYSGVIPNSAFKEKLTLHFPLIPFISSLSITEGDAFNVNEKILEISKKSTQLVLEKALHSQVE